MTTPVFSIEAQHLVKRFGSHTALHGLSFQIRQGEIVGFLGPNGAGKSTTLRILTGVLAASAGCAWVCGLPVAHQTIEMRRLIGYMPENNPLPEDMRVIEYLRFRAALKGIPWRRRRQAIEQAMEVCELQHKARGKIIGTLSKGFRQRVGIADAILGMPRVTILDEPTIGLDPHQVLAIRALLNQLRGETTVIFSSHILSEVEISCDRVLILNQGYLVASGTADELRCEFLPGARFRLELSGRDEDVRAVLRSLDPRWQIETSLSANSAGDGDFRQLDLLHPNPVAQHGDTLLAALMAAGLRVRSFSPLQPTLEDIFLTATRRSWKEQEPALPDAAQPQSTDAS